MLKKSLTLLGCSFLLTTPVLALSLDSSISYALTNGPDIKIAQEQIALAKADLNIAREGYYPNVSFDVGIGYEKIEDEGKTIESPEYLARRRAKLQARQNIFNGFKDRYNVLHSLAKIKASNYQVDSNAEQIALQVINAYLDVLMYKEINKYAKNSLAAHNKIYAQIEKRSESGISKVIDLDQARGRIASARTSLMGAQAELLDAQTNFNRIVGTAATDLELPIMPDNALPETQNAAIAIAVSKHPDLLAAGSQIAASKASYMGLRSDYYPHVDINLSGNYDKNANGQKTEMYNYAGMLNVSFNLIEGGRSSTLKKSANELAINRTKRDILYRELEQRVRYSWNAFTSAKTQLNYYEQHTNSAQRVRDAYIKQFELGQRTLLDLLDTENEFFQARVAFVIGQYKELRGRYALLNSMGMLLPTLNISVEKH